MRWETRFSPSARRRIRQLSAKCYTPLVIVLATAMLLIYLYEPRYIEHRHIHIYHEPRIPPTKILTLFTSVKATTEKDAIERNMILNWSLLNKRVNLILFVEKLNSDTISKLATKYGWSVRQCATHRGLPIIRWMFLEAQNISDTAFYGYSNADILFTSSLIQTLDSLHNYIFPGVLMVGQRTNCNVSLGEPLVQWEQVRLSAELLGELFEPYAQDYFITTKNGYPWHDIPDLVIGRIGYDNWLLRNAIESLIPLVDITSTTLALHQTDSAGNFEGASRHDEDRLINYKIAGKFMLDDYVIGRTTCSQLVATVDEGIIDLRYRHNMSQWCQRLYRSISQDYQHFRHAIQPLNYMPSTRATRHNTRQID